MPLRTTIGTIGDGGGDSGDGGLFKFGKPPDRQDTPNGTIASYIHAGGRVGALVELRSETDFVARTEEFHSLAREIAMQVAAMNPGTIGSMDSPSQGTNTLLDQEYIRDASKTVRELIKETINKVGENITVSRFVRYEVGTS
jgi:elongation factor Ts